MNAMQSKKLLNHLNALVSMYPVSSNQAAVLDALKYCQKVISITNAFSDTKIHTINGFHSLTASTKTTKMPKLLLQAHIDVVPSNSDLHTLSRDGDRIIGRGVFDMLFAVASYLVFIEENRNALSTLDIGLMLSGDEELGGFNGVAALIENGYGCEVCILPDAGNGFGDLNVAAKGVFGFDLVVKGRAHHGSRPWEGDGAANKLVHLLHHILQLFDESSRENSTLTIARLNSGDADNKGPNEAVSRLDIRYRDDADYLRLKTAITKLAKKYDATLERIDQGDDYQLDMNHPRITEFLALYTDHHEREITLGKAHGSSDARFFSSRGIPVIMLRPDGFGAHSDEEYLSLTSLTRFHALLEEYVLKTAKIEIE